MQRTYLPIEGGRPRWRFADGSVPSVLRCIMAANEQLGTWDVPPAHPVFPLVGYQHTTEDASGAVTVHALVFPDRQVLVRKHSSLHGERFERWYQVDTMPAAPYEDALSILVEAGFSTEDAREYLQSLPLA